jgi:hypothetical protein
MQHQHWGLDIQSIDAHSASGVLAGLLSISCPRLSTFRWFILAVTGSGIVHGPAGFDDTPMDWAFTTQSSAGPHISYSFSQREFRSVLTVVQL